MSARTRTLWLSAITLLAAACVRLPSGQLRSIPTIVDDGTRVDYATSAARVAHRQLADDSVVARGGRSILMTHDAPTPHVFVLLHGFSDSPRQFETIGEHLFAAGDNVFIPRLPHHAEREAPLRALGRVRADELRSFGDSVVDEARGLGDSVVVVGLSAGGVVAASIAQTRAVQRAVIIAPALAPFYLAEDRTRDLVTLVSRLPDITRTPPADTARPDYVQGTTSRGLANVLDLGQRIRLEAETQPAHAHAITFLLNARDRTVSERASRELAQSWYRQGAAVSVYRFPAEQRLPHNVMELTARGGNTDVVYPVVEALARATTPPKTVELQPGPCRGPTCVIQRWFETR